MSYRNSGFDKDLRRASEESLDLMNSELMDAYFGDASVGGKKIKANSITVTELAFTPTESDNIVATINASTEGIEIIADLITVSGDCTFTAGYDPTGKIATSGAASDVNSNVTTISGGKITTNSITATQINSNTITATEIVAGTITATEVANATLTGSKMVNGTITGTQIANATISGSKIVNGTITGTQIASSTISGSKIVNSTITGGKIAANTLTASQIAANSIGTSELAANAVTAGHIQANAVGASEINVTNLQAVSANMGTVKVGGSGNGYGQLMVYNSSNQEIAKLENDGIIVRNTRALFLEGTGSNNYWDLSVNSSNHAVMSLTTGNQFYIKDYAGTTNLFTVSSANGAWTNKTGYLVGNDHSGARLEHARGEVWVGSHTWNSRWVPLDHAASSANNVYPGLSPGSTFFDKEDIMNVDNFATNGFRVWFYNGSANAKNMSAIGIILYW